MSENHAKLWIIWLRLKKGSRLKNTQVPFNSIQRKITDDAT